MLRERRECSAFGGDGQRVRVAGTKRKAAMACFVEALGAAKLVGVAAGGD